MNLSMHPYIPDADGLYGRGYRDALESQSLALRAAGVDERTVAAAYRSALDAYGNHAHDDTGHTEIHQVLVLSTAHLPIAEREQLDSLEPFAEAQGLRVSMRCDYGWLISLDRDHVVLPVADWPALSEAAAYARALGATHVRFDADGPVQADLRHYDED
jgi:hypothetical protein